MKVFKMCPKCGAEHQPKDYQLKNSDYRCRGCLKAANRKYSNSDRALELHAENNREKRNQVSNSYVRDKFRQEGITNPSIEMIDERRLIIKIRRSIKQKQNEGKRQNFDPPRNHVGPYESFQRSKRGRTGICNL